MNSPLIEISTRIRSELDDLDQVVERVHNIWDQAQKASEDHDIFIDSVALNLHSFYTGIERLFELIARHIDDSIPAGDTWHRDLLLQMCDDSKDVRPAVIDSTSAVSLDEFRRFRHLVRNVYTVNLSPEKMRNLIFVLPDLWAKIHAELLAFSDFIVELDNEQ